tara:strand:- start:359 stop:538 length:180 start_codon:yes stop_codon:yes gene_type:complete
MINLNFGDANILRSVANPVMNKKENKRITDSISLKYKYTIEKKINIPPVKGTLVSPEYF